MPGHKGEGGKAEKMDITEIYGADSLFEADGIIAESERIAGEIFGADTFYSTEGSSLSIRAMLHLALLYAKRCGKTPRIAAGRNAHKSFASAAALIGFEVDWILARESSYLSARLDREDIIRYFESVSEPPTAVYLTSPDYLGAISDISAIAEECKSRGVLLLVDNAHGAYLKFLSPSRHPIDLGADICCDSAHKTLPALTGCGYIHISKSLPSFFKERCKDSMMLFASTSPSYLLLDSLDRLNPLLSDGFVSKMQIFIDKIELLKQELRRFGYLLFGDEPMKLTISAKEYGYLGTELADIILKDRIYSEFADPDYLVLMPTPENSDEDLKRLLSSLKKIPKKQRIDSLPPTLTLPKTATSIRDAVMADTERLPISKCIGRIAATVRIGCPPAVPIILPGEIIDENTVKCFEYYGVTEYDVLKYKNAAQMRRTLKDSSVN